MPATIKSGSAGPDVTAWQGLLTSAGFSVESSGVFDAATDSATRAWQKSKGLAVDGVVGPASWGAMTGVAQAGLEDKWAKFGRDTLLAVWPQILEEAATSKYPEVQALGAQGMPNLAELQTAGAMAQLESNYGRSGYKNNVTGETSGIIWNWGAVQAPGKPPCDPNTSFETSDTGPSGTYNACYKKYPTAEAGALDFLRLLTVKRPNSWAIMKTGDLDAYSVAMHSWTPPLTQLGAGHAGSVQNLDPISHMPGYFEQPPLTTNGRAAGLAKRAANIAFTLNEPLAVGRGGPPVQTGEVPGATSMTDLVPTTTAGKGLVAALFAAAAAGAWLWFSKRR